MLAGFAVIYRRHRKATAPERKAEKLLRQTLADEDRGWKERLAQIRSRRSEATNRVYPQPGEPFPDRNRRSVERELNPPSSLNSTSDVRYSRVRTDAATVKEPVLQEVLFATNRALDIANPDATIDISAITHLRFGSLCAYGRAWVSIPQRHKLGTVERPKFRWLKMRIEAEDPAWHFVLAELTEMEDVSFYNEVGSSWGSSALVFVHGYNTSFQDAIFRAAQIAHDGDFPGKIVAFSWPSRSSVAFYDYDRESALASARDLFTLLQRIKTESKIENLFVVAHSLGSQIVIDALQMASLSGADLNIREVIFAAPDVDRDVFKSRADLIKKVAAGVTVYASSADRALLVSKTKAGGTPRAGDVPVAGPMLIPDVDLIDVTSLGADMFALNHGIFATSHAVLGDLGRIVTSQTRPPHIRTPTLSQILHKEAQHYWKFHR